MIRYDDGMNCNMIMNGINYEYDMVMNWWLTVTIWNETHDLSLWNENEWYDYDIAELFMIMTYYWMEWIIIYILIMNGMTYAYDMLMSMNPITHDYDDYDMTVNEMTYEIIW